jgi:hypothetical protein
MIALVSLTWRWHALVIGGRRPLWIRRQQGLYLSGLPSIALMSLAMLLATRPAWLEVPLGGMDRVYRGRKWAGFWLAPSPRSIGRSFISPCPAHQEFVGVFFLPSQGPC